MIGRRAGTAQVPASPSKKRLSSPRPPIPSLLYAWCRWLSTVRTAIPSRSAISRLLKPREASMASSTSRGVNLGASSVPNAGVQAPWQACSQRAELAAAARALACLPARR